MKLIFLLAIALLCSLVAPARAEEVPNTQLEERSVERRAIEAVNWGLPAVNYDRMVQAAIGIGAGYNQVVYWSGLTDWKNQTLTPNPDVIYVQPFIDTKDAGPMVLDIPPAGDGSITGTMMDCWQAALEDVGPAGVDKGAGGKYLILPPGYKDAIPQGYIVLPSDTFRGYALLRSIPKSGNAADVAKAVDYAKRISLYPLSQAARPPQTRYVDALGTVFDSTIPYDIRFFESLDRMIQAEPWLERDKAMIDPLRTIGIERGKPFNPDAKVRTILEGAAREGRAWLNARYETVFPAYFEGAQWTLPAMPELVKTVPTFYETADAYSIDARGLTDYWAFTTVKHLGAGQFYLLTIRDGAGDALDGGGSYRLRVPANVPARQYWSAVVYDRATHALVRNAFRPSRLSTVPDLRHNSDGSVDLFFGPSAPAGQESNWIPTKPGGRFEVLFRFYGPEKPLLDKTWKLPDLEEVAGSTPSGQTASSTNPSMSPERAREENAYALGLQAYLWGYPLRYYSVSSPKSVAVGGSYINDFRRYTELKTSKDRFVVTPNNVTIDAYGTMDLSSEPVVIVVPHLAESRWYIVQIGDSFDEIIHNIGGTKGQQPGVYVVTGPDFPGTVPGEMTRIKSRTKFGVAAVRILAKGSADLRNAVEAQKGFFLMPLSAYLRSGLAYKAPANRPQMATYDSKAPKDIRFFDELGYAMSKRLPASADSEDCLVASLSQIGLSVGKGFDWQVLDAATRRGLARAATTGEQIVDSKWAAAGEVVNGWKYTFAGGRAGFDPGLRAALAKYEVGAQLSDQVIYPNTGVDDKGEALAGNRNYVLHFEPGQLPPVSVFWNMAMYGSDMLFVENTVGRYSIGSTTDGLKPNADGSLTILIQKDRPADASNWLPAPDGNFNLTVRLYGPTTAVLDGSYRLPPVQRVP